MIGNIIDLASRRRPGDRELKRSAKVARGYDRPRFLYMGSKTPRGGIDTVELCIVSNEAGAKRRILSRVTVEVEALRGMLRELDAERPFHPEVWVHDVELEPR